MNDDSEKSTYKKCNKKQLDFLKVLDKNMGLIQISCEKFGIDRQTFYNWKNGNEDFRNKVENINEKLLDLSEGKLMQLINNGEPSAIFFHLKCKGKKRGYIEKQEIEHSGDMNITINKITK